MKHLFEVRKKAIEYSENLSDLSDEMKELIYNSYIEGAKYLDSLNNSESNVNGSVTDTEFEIALYKSTTPTDVRVSCESEDYYRNRRC